MQHSTMPTVVPQKPTTLFSRVDRKFMPKMPATIAPIPAEKLPMLNVSSSLLTCTMIANPFSIDGNKGCGRTIEACQCLTIYPQGMYCCKRTCRCPNRSAHGEAHLGCRMHVQAAAGAAADLEAARGEGDADGLLQVARAGEQALRLGLRAGRALQVVLQQVLLRMRARAQSQSF